jgi:uncharacterized protein with FMN-binding domain
VFKRGRKGRISNELVAASCAAILAVYAAGSWRTRDEARRFAAEGQMRRPVQAAPAAVAPAPAAAVPAVVAAAVARPVPAAPSVAIKPKPAAKKKPVQVVAAPSPEPAIPAPAPTPAPALAPEPAPIPEASVAAAEAQSPAADERRWHDGYFTGWGQSRHGDIQAFVRIEAGKIVDAGIATCETRYPCYVIDSILHQPVDLQGPGVDRVSRATESADAYYFGLVQALSNAEAGTFRSVRP